MLFYLSGFVILFSMLVIYILIKKNMHLWVNSYLKGLFGKKFLKEESYKPKHIILCFVDHFEPTWSGANYEKEAKRVDTWVYKYPRLARKHKDADGKCPAHTFFYPEEEYRPEHINKIAKICNEGFGEIEIHLHHDQDTSDNFKATIERFKQKLTDHNVLSRHRQTKQVMYAFIHGNWALDNSRLDGRMCGVNNELIILRETGCYADFTQPSAPSDTQTKKINSLYYAKDDPLLPKSHNDGIDVKVGRKPTGDLMIIQGPLTLNWKDRKWGVFPRIENGDISAENPPGENRVDMWIKENICVEGKPEWVFVKIHTHGCQEKHFDTLFGEPMDKMFNYLETKYNDGNNYQLHYVTAREMYNIIKAAEAGEEGNPNEYRDYFVVRQPDGK